MEKEQLMVVAFHDKFGFTTNDRPTIIEPELFRVRHEHTLSELDELKQAYDLRSLEKIADAITDAIYFLKGTATAFGIDLEPVFEEIHRSNMTKANPEGGGDKKAVKGSDYSPPNLTPILLKQIDEIPKDKALLCSCGMCYQYSRLDAEAHAKVYSHTLELIDKPVAPNRWSNYD